MTSPEVLAPPGPRDEGITEDMFYQKDVGNFTHMLKSELVDDYLKKLSADQGLKSEIRQFIAENYWEAISRKSKEARKGIKLFKRQRIFHIESSYLR